MLPPFAFPLSPSKERIHSSKKKANFIIKSHLMNARLPETQRKFIFPLNNRNKPPEKLFCVVGWKIKT